MPKVQLIVPITLNGDPVTKDLTRPVKPKRCDHPNQSLGHPVVPKPLRTSWCSTCCRDAAVQPLAGERRQGVCRARAHTEPKVTVKEPRLRTPGSRAKGVRRGAAVGAWGQERPQAAWAFAAQREAACRGDQSPTASLRTLMDIYSPLSHYRPCLNQLYLAKTFKIASFIQKGSSRAQRV